MKTSSLVIRSAVIAALGGLLFGYDTAVISGTTESLKTIFQLNEVWLGFTVAIALLGTICGAATAQIPSNRLGRKPTLAIMAVLYFVSAVGSAWPETLSFGNDGLTWYSFLFFRFIGGIGVGAASVVSPMYTAEIAPAKSRGLLVAFTQFNIVFGILLAYLCNFIIASLSLGDTEWRLMFGLEALPAAAFFFLIFLNPESPRWLITQGRVDEAKKLLDRLGTDTGNVEEEVKIIQDAIAAEQKDGKERFFCRRYRYPIMLAICIAAFNQLSGINAILYYAPKIFLIAGASKSMAMFLPVIVGLTNLVFTMAAMTVIDRFGRKKLMLVGSIGYIASLAVVAGAFIYYGPQFNLSIKNVARQEAQDNLNLVEKSLENAPESEKTFWQKEWKAAEKSYHSAVVEYEQTRAEQAKTDLEAAAVPMTGIMIVLVGLMAFIAAHAFGQGACIWVFISEIFPNRIRAQGQALGAFTHWILCAVVSQLFPPLLVLLGPSTIFIVFAGLMCLQLLWVLGVMPETKQVSLEDLQKQFGITDTEILL